MSEVFQYNSWVTGSNLAIVLLSLLFMFLGDSYSFSLNKIVMLFSFFFFGIAPILQYQKGIVLWGGASFSSSDYIGMNMLVIFILFLYQGSYYLFSRLRMNNLELRVARYKKEEKLVISRERLLALACFSVLVTLYMNKFNLLNLLLRSGQKVTTEQALMLVYSNFVRPIPIVCLLIAKQHEIGGRLYRFLLVTLVVITNFPTASARFYVAATYLPLLLVYVPFLSKRYMALNKLMILGLLIVFPFLDQMRNITRLSDIKLSLDFSMFTTGHFDSYQMFLRVMVADVVTYGRQLLTAFLFFVPRSWWPGKSVGSGHLMAELAGLSFTNISMNYFGEGYINFGYLGIFLFATLLALINARFDKIYWTRAEKSSPLSAIYFLLLGLEFFILRGDLLSSFAFTVGLCSSVAFVYAISSRSRQKKADL